MFSLNISCPVCKEVFKRSDAIYSTSCGHVFHFNCMNQWRLNSTSCPQCRSYNPTSYGIYLNFDDSQEYEQVVKDLNTKLESGKNEMKKIQEENLKKDKKIDDVKRLYNISEQWRADLSDNIHKLVQENEEKSSDIESMKTHIETLENENGVQNLFDKINKFSKENSKLKQSLSENETINIILNQKSEMLEQRLKQVNSELQKQIEENLKKENIAKINQQAFPSVTRRPLTPSLNANRTLNQPKEFKPFKLTQPNDLKVVISDFPRNNLMHPLVDTVFLLASKMFISLTAEDILNVSIINRNGMGVMARMTQKVAILVEFKTIEGKIKFLEHRNRLHFDNLTKSIHIKEHIDEEVYKLFMYANRNLRGNGYEYVSCKDNKVYVKKKLIDREEILIKNKDEVDKLLGVNPLLTRNATATGTYNYGSLFNLSLF